MKAAENNNKEFKRINDYCDNITENTLDITIYKALEPN